MALPLSHSSVPAAVTRFMQEIPTSLSEKHSFSSPFFFDNLELLWPSQSARNMETQSSSLSREDMEYRRLQAARELANGSSQSRVARKFGVSRTTTSRWRQALDHKGVDGLRRRRATGRPSRLTSEQRSGIVLIHAEGASAFGFPDDRWTTARLADAIEKRYGVRYDQDHVGRLMHALGLRKPKVHYIFELSSFAADSPMQTSLPAQ